MNDYLTLGIDTTGAGARVDALLVHARQVGGALGVGRALWAAVLVRVAEEARKAAAALVVAHGLALGVLAARVGLARGLRRGLHRAGGCNMQRAQHAGLVYLRKHTPYTSAGIKI